MVISLSVCRSSSMIVARLHLVNEVPACVMPSIVYRVPCHVNTLFRLPGPWQVLQHEAPPAQLLAWSTTRPTLAVGHSSSGAVLLYNCSPAAAPAGGDNGAPCTLKQPQQVLVHQLQQQVSSLAWRPVHSSMLAVGCCGGVALWSLGKLPLSAAAMHRGAESTTSSATAWTTFLSFRAGCR